MSTVHITLSTLTGRATNYEFVPVPASTPKLAETLTTSATTATSTIAAPALDLFWSVTARDADLWVAFGATPDPSAGLRHLVLAGTTRDYAVTKAGEKFAAKEA